MKKGFRKRLAESAASRKGRIVLADDVPLPRTDSIGLSIQRKAMNYMHIMSEYTCAVKLNLHLILPLNVEQLKEITTLAHSLNMQAIADIKLNDIGNTNLTVLKLLKKAGFDSVIVNPIMGPENLHMLTSRAHALGKGVISLVHMSHPDARKSYGLDLAKSKKNIQDKTRNQKLHDLFLQWSIGAKVDGIVVGATVPHLIYDFKKKIKDSCDIFSPGIGIQGGDIQKALKAGMDYAIVGRSIIQLKNPKTYAQKLQSFFTV